MNNKEILFTFDYELFLGESGSIERCLLEPTSLLIKLFKKNKVNATFFIDTTFLQRLKEQGFIRQFSLVERQLQSLVENGHRIELHLHPNWYDSKFSVEDRAWVFENYRYYQLRNCPDSILRSQFENGYEILVNSATKVDSGYRPIAFRAGGWCVDPIGKILEMFDRYNILIDSSVLPNTREEGEISSYDYSDIKASSPYRFEKDVHDPTADGRYLEIPVSTFYQPFVREVIRLTKALIIAKTHPDYVRIIGDGKTIGSTGRQKSKFSHLWSLLKSKDMFFTTDGYRTNYLISSLEHAASPITVVGHPKVLSNSSLDMIARITSKDYCFLSIYDYYRKHY